MSELCLLELDDGSDACHQRKQIPILMTISLRELYLFEPEKGAKMCIAV